MTIAFLRLRRTRAMHEGARPHVVHATECLAGGTLGFLVRLVHELDALGVSQTLVYSRRPDTAADALDAFPASLRTIEVPAARGWHVEHVVAMMRRLHQAIAERPTIAVHLHSSKAGFVGRLALALTHRRVRVLYSPHGLAFLNRRKRLASAAYRCLEMLAGRLRCQPVGCSEGEAEWLERITGRAALVLENPVAPEFFDIPRTPTTPPVVLSIGRVCEQKAPEVFAELAVRMEVDELHTRFVWVGAGESEREAQLRAVGAEVTGWVASDDVRRHLSAATVYVQTSRWEGMPLSVIQAMAAGVPCVVTDVVGNRDAIRHGTTGFIARDLDELASYVALLLRHPELRTRVGEAARRDAFQRFGPRRFRESIAQLYGITLSEPPRPRPVDTPQPATTPEVDVVPVAVNG